MLFNIVQESRIGGRPYQQDRIGHWSTRTSLLMVLADGMGGHERGEVAAQVALDYLGFEFRRDAKPRITNPDVFLFRALTRAHAAIQQEAKRLKLAETPATVIVACVVQDGHAYWSHVGDSRLYHIRAGRVLARTHDHTRVQLLVDEGRIREEAIPSHPDRNKLLQCLGGQGMPKIAPAEHAQLAKNDVLLLCSDGLWGPITQRQILMSVLSRDLAAAVRELADLAEGRAGEEADNISIMALSWGEDEITAVTVPMGDAAASGSLETPTQPQAVPGNEYLNMSDADIDRAVADIRASVARGKPGGTK